MNIDTLKQDIQIINKLGLHARAAAKLVSTASQYDAEIHIGYENKMVNAKSIMGVMMLAASKGTTLQLTSEGKDAEIGLQAITDLINNFFGEEE